MRLNLSNVVCRKRPVAGKELAILQELRDIKRYTLLQAKTVIDLDDACLLTGLSKSRLYALTSGGKIPYHKSPGGRNVYFDRKELDEWMLSRRFATDEELEQTALAYTFRKRLKL